MGLIYLTLTPEEFWYCGKSMLIHRAPLMGFCPAVFIYNLPLLYIFVFIAVYGSRIVLSPFLPCFFAVPSVSPCFILAAHISDTSAFCFAVFHSCSTHFRHQCLLFGYVSFLQHTFPTPVPSVSKCIVLSFPSKSQRIVLLSTIPSSLNCS